MTITGEQLRAEFATSTPLGDIPAKIDARTREGRRWKRRLLAETIAFREQGYTFMEIGEAFGVQPGTLMMWCVVAGRSDLGYRSSDRDRRPATGVCHGCGVHLPNSNRPGRRPKYCSDHCRQLAFGGATAQRANRQRAEAMERRARISALRQEYRRRRATGEHLPWHILRKEPEITVEHRAELQALTDQQRKDGERIGTRPWLVSMDAPVSAHDDDVTLLDTLVLADERAASEIEELMIQNGADGMPARPVKQRPWRIRRPVREMRRAA